ncbi:hypothetical protein CLAIMM_00332 [Cladophialophora immunda]|nr:hypothetical protein CLAIMM_00332 [Cladophialophora immunda]
MYEFLNSSPSPQPLSPHLTLKQSSSCVTINSYTSCDKNDENEGPDPANTSPSTPSRAVQLLRLGLFSSPSQNNIDPSSPSSNARTRGQFKPQRANKGTSSYQLRQFAEATLGSGSLRKAVKLPEGEDLNEWLAVNGNHICLSDRAEREIVEWNR